MRLPSVNRRSPTPLYYQIGRSLLERIYRRDVKPGDPMPSELAISSGLRVSRMTARHALKSLCNLGVAYSLKGKGTFVSGLKLEKNFRQVRSFTEEMEALGLRPTSRVLGAEIVAASAEVAEALRIAPGQEVVRLDRLRLADSVPMGIERSHLPHRLCPGLIEAFDVKFSLYRELWEHYGVRMEFADEEVEAGLAGTKEAKLLRIRRDGAVFLFTRISYIRDGQPAEYVKATYRADRYKIVSRLTRIEHEFASAKSFDFKRPSAGRKTVLGRSPDR